MLPSLVALAKASYTSTPTAALAGRVFKRAQKGLFHGKVKRFGMYIYLFKIQDKTVLSLPLVV
jgi:hypothetical protein